MPVGLSADTVASRAAVPVHILPWFALAQSPPPSLPPLYPVELPRVLPHLQCPHTCFPPRQPISQPPLLPLPCPGPVEICPGRPPGKASLSLVSAPCMGGILCQLACWLSPQPGCSLSGQGLVLVISSHGTLHRGTWLVCNEDVQNQK